MSGVAGGQRIQKADVQRTFNDYVKKVLSKIPGFKNATLSGSVKLGSKSDYGDLDLITYFEGDDKTEIKKDIIKVVSSLPDSIIVPFQSEKYTGRKYYNAGELISVLFPISGTDQNIQVDNIIATSPEEQSYKTSFLDLPAEKQGLLIGLAKVLFLEEDSKSLFRKIGLTNIPQLEQDEELEFNLSSSRVSLRVVKLDNFKEVGRKEIWNSTDWQLVDELFKDYNTDGNFEDLLNSIVARVKNPRSKRRIAGVFKSMVSVKSGEVNTPKGDNKIKAIEKVDSVLTENVEGSVALYPGGFKPPHKGHFSIVENLAKQADLVMVLIGPKDRDGVTAEQSKRIWEIYRKYITTPIAIIVSKVTPVLDTYLFIETHKDDYSKITVAASENDLGRYKALRTDKEKYGEVNIQGLPVVSSNSGEKLSASDIRTSDLKGTYWMPDQLSKQDQQQVLSILSETLLEVRAYVMAQDLINKSVVEFFSKNKDVTINEQPTAIGLPIPSKNREQLAELYQALSTSKYITCPASQDYIFLDPFRFSFQQNRIVVTVEDVALRLDLTEHVDSLLEFMVQSGYSVDPLPTVNFNESLQEGSAIFSKTGYYDPDTFTITIFTEGRHPKDILKTFTHEMIHHIQNVENRLPEITTTDTTEDKNLNEIEQEAYLEGSMLFRMWEDQMKNTVQ